MLTHQDSYGGGESDSLEYFIRFPAATAAEVVPSEVQMPAQLPLATSFSGNDSNGAGGGAESDYVFVVDRETSNVPIVLLLGWAGCQDKYLMKYSKIYEDRG